MVGVEKLESDIEIKAPALKFHQVFAKRPHHVPNASADKFPHFEHHDGDLGAQGSIQTWHYVRDGKVEKAKVVVEKIEADDEKQQLIRWRFVEGSDLLKEDFKSFVSMIEVSPKPNNEEGSVVHWTLEFEKAHGFIDHPNWAIDLVSGMAKDLDAHLLQDL